MVLTHPLKSLSDIFLPLYLPPALVCLPNLLQFGTSQRPPRRQTLHLFCPAAKRQSVRCLPALRPKPSISCCWDLDVQPVQPEFRTWKCWPGDEVRALQQGRGGKENSLGRQEMSGKLRGKRGEDSHAPPGLRIKANLSNMSETLRLHCLQYHLPTQSGPHKHESIHHSSETSSYHPPLHKSKRC